MRSSPFFLSKLDVAGLNHAQLQFVLFIDADTLMSKVQLHVPGARSQWICFAVMLTFQASFASITINQGGYRTLLLKVIPANILSDASEVDPAFLVSGSVEK